jgi:hypothetical protein
VFVWIDEAYIRRRRVFEIRAAIRSLYGTRRRISNARLGVAHVRHGTTYTTGAHIHIRALRAVLFFYRGSGNFERMKM